MSRLSKLTAAVLLAGASASASAWWGGPFSSWAEDFFGDIGFSFNFSMSGTGRGVGRAYDYYGPYAYPYEGVPVPAQGYAPAGLTPEQQKALAERQAQALQQAVEAQRHFAEQLAAQPRPDRATGPDHLPGFEPFSPARGAVDPMRRMTNEPDAALAKTKSELEARREASRKRAQERREALEQRLRTATPWQEGTEQKNI